MVALKGSESEKETKNSKTIRDCSLGRWKVQRWCKPGNLGYLFPLFGLFLDEFGYGIFEGLDG